MLGNNFGKQNKPPRARASFSSRKAVQAVCPLRDGAMECDPSHEDGTRPERAGGSASPVAQQADPRGFHERTFLGQSNAAEAEPELEEKDIGPEFDSYEDLAGDKLRLLDR